MNRTYEVWTLADEEAGDWECHSEHSVRFDALRLCTQLNLARGRAIIREVTSEPGPRCPAHGVALVPSTGLVSAGWECPVCLEPTCEVCEEKMPRCTCGGDR